MLLGAILILTAGALYLAQACPEHLEAERRLWCIFSEIETSQDVDSVMHTWSLTDHRGLELHKMKKEDYDVWMIDTPLRWDAGNLQVRLYFAEGTLVKSCIVVLDDGYVLASKEATKRAEE